MRTPWSLAAETAAGALSRRPTPAACARTQDAAALRRVLDAGLPVAKGLGATKLAALQAWCDEQAAANGGAAPTLAEAVMGSGWGGALDAPAPPGASCEAAAAALALPGPERLVDAMLSSEAGARAGGGAASEARKSEEDAALETFWDERLSAGPRFLPATAGPEVPLPPPVAKGGQAKVVVRLRGLVALARAAAAAAPPATVMQVRGARRVERDGARPVHCSNALWVLCHRRAPI